MPSQHWDCITMRTALQYQANFRNPHYSQTEEIYSQKGKYSIDVVEY
jgi:hypothetical protein